MAHSVCNIHCTSKYMNVQSTDPVEVFDNRNFSIIVYCTIDDIVLFHIHADVLIHLLDFVLFELERAL